MNRSNIRLWLISGFQKVFDNDKLKSKFSSDKLNIKN